MIMVVINVSIYIKCIIILNNKMKNYMIKYLYFKIVILVYNLKTC